MIKLKCKIFHNPCVKGIRGQASMEFYRSTRTVPHGASGFAVTCHKIKAGVRVRGLLDYISDGAGLLINLVALKITPIKVY